jgi:long-chain alkane monooxygenase
VPAVPSARPRPLHFAASVITTPGHHSPGPGPRGLTRQEDADGPERWVRLAMTLERGRFDAVFFADAAGHRAPRPRNEPGSRETSFQVPGSHLPALAGAVAYATRHLGVALTASMLQEHPVHFARRISALDHASRGRVAWDLVTDRVPGAWSQEYLEVTCKLWEGSWDDDALGPDGRAGSHASDGKVHRINHQGPRYTVEGPHLVSPSPQRTPLLFHAAASEADRAFAVASAEAVIIHSSRPAEAARAVADIRSRAASHGRLPQDIKIFQTLPGVTGTPEQIADELASWQDAGVDGINLVSPGCRVLYEEFVRHVAPVLQARGLMQREYADGTLRHKLFGHGDRLPGRHPAARYRGAFAPQHA